MPKHHYFLLLLALSLTTCVEPVDFDGVEPADLLVVDGFISASEASSVVWLSKAGSLENRRYDPVSGATITLVEENGAPVDYVEVEAGKYELSAAVFRGTTGRSYSIDIELEDGTRYRSRPEIIPNSVQLDSISLEASTEDFVNDLGNIYQRNFVKVSVNLTIPDTELGPFLRWKVDDVYLITEKKCGPLDNVKSCYIRPPDNTPDLNLFSGTDFTAGFPYRQEIVRRGIDYAFGERYSFSVYQIVHTQNAFEYWSKIDQIVSLEGSIFDIPPAPIPGNIYNVEEEEETVLGYFSAIASDTLHLFATRVDVSSVVRVSPYCGPPEQAWWLSAEGCCECLELSDSSLDRPDFW